MESIMETLTKSASGNIGSTGNLMRLPGGHGQQEQRRGSTPVLNVSISGHRKLCRVAHGQRVILGSTPPVFVAELRPAISTELLSTTKSRSPLNIDVDTAPLSNNALNTKSFEMHDSDLCYTSGSDEHSALSRNASEASETLSHECSYSPTLTTTLAPSGAVETVSSDHSPANTVSSHASGEFALDFSKLSLQDSGYSGSFPLCATNSDASSVASPQMSVTVLPSNSHTPTFDGMNPEYYASLFDFTLKLGYNEAQLKSVLTKLGTTSLGQDKVLAELIKLGQDVQEISVAQDPVISQGNRQGPIQAPISGTAQQCGLRSIVIDGSNVAMTHGNKVVFSCLGIRLCVDWFRRRGHTDIKVFVPQFRKEQSRSDNPITDQHVLFDLEKENVLVWTPSRRLGGRRIICHDDRYILKTAVDKNAVIVSNDEYRDMMYENADFRKAVEERLLMYNFIDGKFIVPDDPLGRYGPKLDQFLSKSSPNSSAPPCPYGRKCTYGNKCKFFHPERPGGLHRSVTERLRDHAELHRRISPTNSLQFGRLGAADGFGDGYYPGKSDNGSQRQGACRTQSLNPSSLLRQNSSTSPPGRFSPPSSSSPYRSHLLEQSAPGDEWKYSCQARGDIRLQRVQADSGHVALSKQMSNPEAARNHLAHFHAAANERGYLVPPALAPPDSLLRQIWQNEQQSHQHCGDENRLQAHHPVLRNMSAPGVNILKQSQLNYPPPTNVMMGNYASDYQRKNSVSDSQLNLLGAAAGPVPSADDDPFYPLFGGSNCNYYIPSTTVWGPVEHSSSPIFTSSTTGWGCSATSSPPVLRVAGDSSPSPPANALEGNRAKVRYHLSQLFPDELVNAVMKAHPNETDPQKLCALILGAREKSEKCGGNESNCVERS